MVPMSGQATYDPLAWSSWAESHTRAERLSFDETDASAEQYSLNDFSSQSTHHDQESHKRKLRGNRSWFRHFWSGNHADAANITSQAKQKERDTAEYPRVIVSKSKTRLVWVILVHVTPILAAAVIASINLQGFFIGTLFVGVSNTKAQSVALLSLQVTAKLLEITVTASLGLIVLELVHYFLLFNDSGLPLGLSGIKLAFTNVFYLLSPSFWTGIGALGSHFSRTSIAFLIVSCGLLANFIGPSAALLLIPTYNDQWPAGGLNIHLTQDGQQLWPAELNASHVGGPSCYNPSEDLVNVPPTNFSSCIWYSATAMGVNINEPAPWNGNFTVDDDENSDQQYWRYISWFTYGGSSAFPVQWNWSGMSFANIITAQLFVNWAMAANGTNTVNATYLGENNAAWGPLSKYARYSYRDPFGSQAELKGTLGPIARVSCRVHRRKFNDSSPLSYPVMPLNGNYRADTNATYKIPTKLVQEISDVRTLWNTPMDNNQDADLEGSENEPLPSAFLAIQFPLNSTTAGAVFACSIDARWTNFTTTFDYFNDQQIPANGVPSTYAKIDSAALDDHGRPNPGQTSAPVKLDLIWLNNLTPPLNRSNVVNATASTGSGYNSFSYSLDAIPRQVDNDDLDDFLEDTRIAIEGILPMLIVDGMARFNLDSLLDGRLGDIQSRWLLDNSTANPEVLLAGGGGLDQPGASSTSEPSGLALTWVVTISGYAYSADNTASTLALVVLFAYMVFALGHIVFTVYKRWSSDAWRSVPAIVALSQNSPRSPLLQNASSGVGLKTTDRLLLQLRATGEPAEADETVHVLVNTDRNDFGYRKAIGYRKIEKGKNYR